MKTNQQKSFFLIVLHIFLAIGALGGGGALILDPTGELSQLPLSLLYGSPFSNYLLPGIILVLVLGVMPLLIALGLYRKSDWLLAEKLNIFHEKHWSWTFSLYIGFALIIWITVQVFIIQTLSMLHFIYILYGLVIQAVTLLPSVQEKYEK